MLERADTAEAIGLNQRASALLDQLNPRAGFLGENGSIPGSTTTPATADYDYLRIWQPAVVKIRLSQVEVYWHSYSNHLYNVQYRSDLTTNQWTDLLPTNILATSSETSVYDDIPRGRPQRFYRLVEVP
jgi:hypothetical protein